MKPIRTDVLTWEELRQTLQRLNMTLTTTRFVLGPAATTANKFPQWDAATRTLKDGLALTTVVGTPGVDTLLPSEKAVRDAIAAAAHVRLHSIIDVLDHSSAATSGRMLQANANGLPVDATNTNAQVAAAVTASHARQHGVADAADHTGVVTTVGTPGVDTQVPTEKAVRDAIAAGGGGASFPALGYGTWAEFFALAGLP